MGFCSRKYFLLTICILQFITLFEKQIFEFLGFLWIPILVNFLEIIFVIFGFFGTYQYSPKYLIVYAVWQVLWFSWNVFIICLYLDLGFLNHKESLVLKLDQGSESWWIRNGPGCRVELNTTQGVPVLENVVNCVMDYRYIEIFQSALQVILAFLGSLNGFCLIRSYLEEDDTSSHKSRKNQKRMSLYSIEFSPQRENQGDSDDYDDNMSASVSPKPMTPRRVKRRSVMQRGTNSRTSTSSRRHTNTSRSSTRTSRRSGMQNPVTRLMEQQQKIQQQQHYDSPTNPNPIDSPYYVNSVNSASSNNLITTQHVHHHPRQNDRQHWQNNGNGHTNPTFQQSSSQSLNEHDDFEDLYNNRPASARSSYSNFHGARSINYGYGQPPPPVPNYHHTHAAHATPQVPQKRLMNPSRQSMRSMAFLNNGPPAYSSHINHLAFDSETTI